MKKKPIVFVDMDDTAVDFSGQLERFKLEYPDYQYPQSIMGFFSTMKPVEGFMDAWNTLSEHYDMRFLTRPSIFNLHSFSEKACWVRDNMGGIDALEKLNINPDKSIVGCENDFLIDDWDIHGQTGFRGEFIHFGKQEGCMNWEEVTIYLLKKIL